MGPNFHIPDHPGGATFKFLVEFLQALDSNFFFDKIVFTF